jgi:hypothetical protein
VIERGDLLDGDLLTRGLVNGGTEEVSVSEGWHRDDAQQRKNIPDDTIGAFTNHILDIILLAHVEGDLAGPRSVRGVRSRHGRCECEVGEDEKEEMLSKKGERATEK